MTAVSRRLREAPDHRQPSALRAAPSRRRGRWSTPTRPPSCATARCRPTASTRCAEDAVRGHADAAVVRHALLLRPERQAPADAGDWVHARRRDHVDRQAAQRRQVPRRHGVQRRRGEVRPRPRAHRQRLEHQGHALHARLGHCGRRHDRALQDEVGGRRVVARAARRPRRHDVLAHRVQSRAERRRLLRQEPGGFGHVQDLRRVPADRVDVGAFVGWLLGYHDPAPRRDRHDRGQGRRVGQRHQVAAIRLGTHRCGHPSCRPEGCDRCGGEDRSRRSSCARS